MGYFTKKVAILAIVLLGIMFGTIYSEARCLNSSDECLLSQAPPAKNVLVVYFSRAGENYVDGDYVDLEVGNTEVLVNKITKMAKVDIFKVEMANPYSDKFKLCYDQAKNDKNTNARPALAKDIDSIDKYDAIIVAYPNYFNTMPMVMFTFLEKHNFSGKRIFPLCTHEGTTTGNSEVDIRRLAKGGDLGKACAILGSKVERSDKELAQWLRDCGIAVVR